MYRLQRESERIGQIICAAGSFDGIRLSILFIRQNASWYYCAKIAGAAGSSSLIKGIQQQLKYTHISIIYQVWSSAGDLIYRQLWRGSLVLYRHISYGAVSWSRIGTSKYFLLRAIICVPAIAVVMSEFSRLYIIESLQLFYTYHMIYRLLHTNACVLYTSKVRYIV